MNEKNDVVMATMRERRDQGKPSTEAAAILQQLLYLSIPRSPKTLPLSVRSISEQTAASSLVVDSILGRGRHLEIHHDDPESQTTLLRPRTLAQPGTGNVGGGTTATHHELRHCTNRAMHNDNASQVNRW
ncbi:hypothetical protein CMUS01_04589 [Colletotrichum musicola]|uniref:Uncharacterized protein n=1 Tax=Colletotrichum musicola TaxID=2175873 RepID=A0A8H6KVP3_9PEZI|nr:hypothetical protein CMUS01_04589 [Colletotrichum musicola]